jgi:hypothetical protein
MTSVNRHLRWECGLEPQFVCEICQRKFYHKHTLTHHLRGAHEIFAPPPNPAPKFPPSPTLDHVKS